MMTTAPEPASPIDPDRIDQRVFLHGVSWEDYERLLELRGESSVPRLTYLEGELELMSPSIHHGKLQEMLGRLLEAWADETGIRIEGVGQWTIKRRRAKRGAEPDKCYILGDDLEPERPDIAIEVVWTHGGLEKLDVYRKLRVPEVWYWKDGALTFHALRGDHYTRIPRSELLPALDPDLIARCMSARSQTDAVRQLRASLRGGA